jgi:hypothetical protein
MQQTNIKPPLFSYQKTYTKTELQSFAQLAIQVEWTTIPVYLTALYSISQPDSQAYQLLRSVVVEEMFHINQACNLLVAIGGLPKFTNSPEAAITPAYPCYLPHANTNTTPFVGLYRASPDVFEDVFAAIETPAPESAMPEGDDYDTIGQLYKFVVDALKAYSGAEPLFAPNLKGRQRIDIYPGKFGGKPTDIKNLKSAAHAVLQVTQQGEGSVPDAGSMKPDERWGAYNHYGNRTDGTYGPIIGTPYEMSHFKKFRTVALDTENFPATHPIISNARKEDFTHDFALLAAEAFDMAYSIMLDAMENSFLKLEKGMPDPFFKLALPLMHQVMPALARILMTTPMLDDGDSSVGPNAAPTYLYLPDIDVGILFDQIGQMIKACTDSDERKSLERIQDSLAAL